MVLGPVRGGGSTLSGVFVMPVLQFESLALDTFAGSREIWSRNISFLEVGSTPQRAVF